MLKGNYLLVQCHHQSDVNAYNLLTDSLIQGIFTALGAYSQDCQWCWHTGTPLTLGELALYLELLHASSELLDVSILGRQWVKVIPEILVQTKPKGKAQVKREGERDRVARLQLLVSFVSS